MKIHRKWSETLTAFKIHSTPKNPLLNIQLVWSDFTELTRINFYTHQFIQKRHFSKRNFDPIQPFYFRERIPQFRRRYSGISREKLPKLSISEPDLRSSTWIYHSTVEVTLLHRFLQVELISINSTKFYKHQGRRRRNHSSARLMIDGPKMDWTRTTRCMRDIYNGRNAAI